MNRLEKGACKNNKAKETTTTTVCPLKTSMNLIRQKLGQFVYKQHTNTASRDYSSKQKTDFRNQDSMYGIYEDSKDKTCLKPIT